VDGDYLAYYGAGNDDTDPGMAKVNALGYIEAFRAVVGADKIVVHMTSKGCNKGERFLAATVKPYQGQRDSGRKPKNHGYLQKFLMDYDGDVFQSKTWATREADDGIGACALYAVDKKPSYIAIATADKDLRMLPGKHIVWRTREVVTVPPGAYEVIGPGDKVYGLKWFWLQMLMGDGADNCPGLQWAFLPNAKGEAKLTKIGEARAATLLADCADTDEAGRRVLDLYLNGYNSSPEFAMDRFVEQAALLWMRTDRTGSLTDFATHTGASRINGCFTQPVWDAVERLSERVEIARKQINSLGG
jgi:hypothetical protein